MTPQEWERVSQLYHAALAHVLHRHHHVAARLEFGDLIGEALGIAALPPERWMHHNGVRAELLGGAYTALELRDRVGAPHPLGDQQTRGVYRQHRHRILLGHPLDGVDVLADRLGPHHQFHAGQHQVEQHDVRADPLEFGKGRRPVGHHGGLEPLLAQKERQRIGQRLLVFDDQHVGHAARIAGAGLGQWRGVHGQDGHSPGQIRR